MKKVGSVESLSGNPRVPSEKHDILYSKARYVLNQRHIKRPWFNLNPFLEKTDESADLENWLPGESKYIQHLESLVLCESFHSDHPVDTKELCIDTFFPYLLSKDWDKGCSIRVLEGQLLDQLLLGLYRLEKQGVAVRHTTYAFARNSRPRTACYKFADKESPGSIEETLLLEFAHFGRLTKEKPNPTTLNPFEYLQNEDSDLLEDEETDQEKDTVTDLPKVQETVDKLRNRGISLSIDRTDKHDTDNKPSWGCRGSIMSKHVKAISFLAAIQSGNRRQPVVIPSMAEYRHKATTLSIPEPKSRRLSIATTRLPDTRRPIIFATPPSHENRRQSTLGQSLIPSFRQQSVVSRPKIFPEKRLESVADKFTPQQTDIDLTSTNPKVPKRRFLNRLLSLDFDDDCLAEETETKDDNEENELPKEADVFYGEEFYLSDQKIAKSRHVKSTRIILRQKKRELHERREEAKRLKELQLEKLKQSRLPLPPPKPVECSDSFQVKYETIQLPDHIPTLEEFVELLREEEYYDPRYRNKMRQKTKKLAQRYYIAKGMHQSSVMFSLANLPDEIRNVTALRPYIGKSLKKRDSADGRSRAHLPQLQTLNETRRSKTPVPEIKNSDSISRIQERAQEVLVVTDSEPCKDHYIKQRRQSLAEVAVSEKVLPTPVSFPKITMCESESESPDTDSEESLSDTDDREEFDTKKLNLKYSIERLRRKRRNKIKKKPAFIEVLAKYYNMQNVLRAFRKGSAGKETKRPRARARQFGKKMKQALQNQEEKMVIGRLKRFNFLEVKEKKRKNLDNLSRGEFSRPDLAKFHKQLKEVLDKFVVRREIVVSDVQTFYNATTCVTFTKLTCFQHKHKKHSI